MKKSSQQKRAKQARRSHEQRKNVVRTKILMDFKRAHEKVIARFKNGSSLNGREKHVIDILVRERVLKPRMLERQRHPQAFIIKEDRYHLAGGFLFRLPFRPIFHPLFERDRSWRG